MNLALFEEKFREDGCFLESAVLDDSTVARLKDNLQDCIRLEAPLRAMGSGHDANQVVCCPYYHPFFLVLLQEMAIISRINHLLGDSSILYSYGNSTLAPGNGNFSSRIHTDRGYFSGDYLDTVGVMVLLDHFSEVNGATWYLPGSHRLPQKPDESMFYSQASRLVAPAGSIFFFHPRLWHAGGINRGETQRDALTLGFCRAHIKQRLDMPALLAGRLEGVDDPLVLQKLGFNARPPATLLAFYEPGEAVSDFRRE